MERRKLITGLLIFLSVSLLGWFAFTAKVSRNEFISSSSSPFKDPNKIQVNREEYEKKKLKILELKEKIRIREENFTAETLKLSKENSELTQKIDKLKSLREKSGSKDQIHSNSFIESLIKEKNSIEKSLKDRKQEVENIRKKQVEFFNDLISKLPPEEANRLREEREYQEKFNKLVNTEQGMWRRMAKTIDTERERIEKENEKLSKQLEEWKAIKAKGGEIPLTFEEEWNGGITRHVEYDRNYIRPEPGFPSPKGSDKRLAVIVIPIPAEFETHRGRIRTSWRMDLPPDVDFYFIIQSPNDTFVLDSVISEAKAWGDMLFLNTDGKDPLKDSFGIIYEYFGKDSDFSVRYDFVAKVDYRCFLLFPQFGNYFDKLPRQSSFFGKIEENPIPHMNGNGYGMSWDLFEKLVQSKTETEEVGDQRVGRIISDHLATKDWVVEPRFAAYDSTDPTKEKLSIFVKYGEDWYDVITQMGWSRNKEFQKWFKEEFKT
eukprot:TRINITY_DN6340_c0_g1_i1.p1 TRINITY_DN6340_c0_g1~~TRINITY_DN6340_c0_g1_i1.p1  ORF type:complete len:490 (-),score=212.64 TRINITY_DN6340_c0_g1_i1:9-1478(-)